MKHLLLVTLCLSFAACSGGTPIFHATGSLAAGKRVTIDASGGEVDVYKPAVGQPSEQFTVAATARGPAPRDAVRVTPDASGFAVRSRDVDLLVRVPAQVTLTASSTRGDVNVTDISGAVNARADDGNVKIMVPGYAQAATGTGNATVFMGATHWPGTLHYSANDGVIELWINATARFNVRLHTDNGSIFTDFLLRGTSHGTSETIVGHVGAKGARQGIDVEVGRGIIRLMQLKPQV